MSVLDTATYIADTPGALLRGLLAGKPGSRATGREVLRLGENKPGFDSGDIPAFLAEIVLDPLTWIGGAGIAKGASYLSKAAKTRKAAKAAETVAAAAKPMAEVIDPRLAQVKEGVEWVGKHYADKAAATKRATGQTNVINPRSGIPMWRDGYKGADDAKNLAAGKATVKADTSKHVSGYYDKADGRSIKYNPNVTKDVDSLKSLGVHEGTHYLTENQDLSLPLIGHINRLNTASKRMWAKRGMERPMDMTPFGEIEGRPMLDYLKDPTEVMARVAQTRQGMEEAGIKALTPSRRSPGLLGTKRDQTARSFNTSVLELTDLPQNVRRDLNDLLKVYGPRLVNHMLRVLPAAAVTTGGAYAAANAMSPRQAVSA